MSKSIVIEREDREAIADPVTDLLRAGAQELIQRADAIREKAIPVADPSSTGRPRLGQ